jgi:hypothetical protein
VPIKPIAPGDDYVTVFGSRQLTRWSADGLAFRTKEAIILVRSPYIDGPASAPRPPRPDARTGWPVGAPPVAGLVARRARHRRSAS